MTKLSIVCFDQYEKKCANINYTLIPNNIKQEFLELENESERIIFIDNFLDSILINIKKDKSKIFKGKILN